MVNIAPNRFLLHSSDGNTQVDYETTSFLGQPVLNLKQGPGLSPIRHFAGSQIRTLSTEFGTLVSVTSDDGGYRLDFVQRAHPGRYADVHLRSQNDCNGGDHYPPHRSEFGSDNWSSRNLPVHSAVW